MKNTLAVVRNALGFLMILVQVAGCSSPPANDLSQTTVVGEEERPVVHTVEITQMKFSPAELTVKKGDTINFVNHDFVTHDITESNKAWHSSPLATNQSWKLKARESASYYCSIHPVMKGKIVVE